MTTLSHKLQENNKKLCYNSHPFTLCKFLSRILPRAGLTDWTKHHHPGWALRKFPQDENTKQNRGTFSCNIKAMVYKLAH